MTFNSPQFALFCLIVGPLFVLLNLSPRTHRLKNLMLLLASLYFYGSWDHRFLFLIILSTVLEYMGGLCLVGREVSWPRQSILVFLLVTSAVVFTAPIDWIGLRGCALPSWVFQAGRLPESSYNGVFVPDGSWLNFSGAIATIGVSLVFFGIGGFIRGPARRHYFLVGSIVSNLALLGFFKYFDFFVGSLQVLLEAVGLGAYDWRLGIIVPVGISFYVFQTMSYVIDIYRGEMEPTEDFIDFALFVTFFPQLVAGPIERARHLLGELQCFHSFNWRDIQVGSYLIAWGFFKKIFIADNVVRFVTPVFASPDESSGPQILLALYAFAIQIYCDFSAYSDIARGLGRMMGIELMVNFNIPYAAANPSEFWRRWHISLSTFLRDYLYKPLGGNRGGAIFIYRNLMITMILGGLWHGARMNFVLWGVYQGLLLVVHRMAQPWLERVEPTGDFPKRVWRLFCWVVFFQFVCFGWLLFRADSFAAIASLTTGLAQGWNRAGEVWGIVLRLLWYITPLLIVETAQFRTSNLLAPLAWPWPVRAAFYLLIFYLTVIFGAYNVTEFIYFQF